MNLADVIERIKGIATSPFRAIGGAADLAALDRVAAGAAQSPAVYVMPIAEDGGANATGTVFVSQLVRTSFSTVIALRDVGDTQGVKQLDQLHPVRVALRDRLLGWTAPDADGPIEFMRGGLIKFENGQLWWNDQWRAASLIRSV